MEKLDYEEKLESTQFELCVVEKSLEEDIQIVVDKLNEDGNIQAVRDFFYSIPKVDERYTNLITLVTRLHYYIIKKEYTTSEKHIIFEKYKNSISTIVGKIANELDILVKNIDKGLLIINNTNWGAYLNRSVKEFVDCIKTTQIFFDRLYMCDKEIRYNSDVLFLMDIYEEHPLLVDITCYFFNKISYIINSYSVTITEELEKKINECLLYAKQQVEKNKYFDKLDIDFNVTLVSPVSPQKAYNLDEDMYKAINDYYKRFKELEKICTRCVFGTMFEYADFSKSIKPNGDVPVVICKVIYDFQNNIIKDKTLRKQWYLSVCKSINRTPKQIYNSQRDFRKD